MKCYCMTLYKWMAEWMHESAQHDIPEELLEDLHIWEKTLREAEPRRLIPDHKLRNVGCVGDASTSYGIGIIISKH